MSNVKKIFVTGFIFLTFLSMIRVHLPTDKKLFKNIYKPIDVYHDFFSIYQDWLMFSPDPARMDSFLTAEVEFDDGVKDQFAFPRTIDMNILEKYINGERYRKIIDESIRRDDHTFLWKDTAKFVLRKVRDRNFNRIPLKVHLTRHWSETPDPNKKFIPHLARKKEFNAYKFYTYEVL